jgi:UDP-glucose 4-epimerase
VSATPQARSVLVTGATGLIGGRVVAELAGERRRGEVERITAVDVRDPPPGSRAAGVEYLRKDIRDPDLERELCERDVDTVVHLAAVVTPGPHSSRDLEYSIDVLGTENVLACAIGAGVRQLVYTSSGAAYGYHADNPRPLRETDPLRGNDEFAYARHKRLAEEALARGRERHPELAQLVFRPGAVLGEHAANPITAIFDRPLIVGVRGADAPFVFIWDEDVAHCIVKGIRERRAGIYNLCGDGEVSLRQIAHKLGKPYVALPAWALQIGLTIGRALGMSRRGPEQVRFLRYRPVLANDRLESEFGFTPTYTSEECFERFRKLRFPAAARRR